MSKQSKLKFAARMRRIKDRLRDEGNQIFGCQPGPLSPTEKWGLAKIFSRALSLTVWKNFGKGARKFGTPKVATIRRFQIDE